MPNKTCSYQCTWRILLYTEFSSLFPLSVFLHGYGFSTEEAILTLCLNPLVSLKPRREWQFLQNHKWSILELLNYFIEHFIASRERLPWQSCSLCSTGLRHIMGFNEH